MTRRLRFTPFLRAGIFGTVILAMGRSAGATDVPFATQPPVSTAADNAESVVAADIDGDGDLDLASASFLDDKLAWYENSAGDGTAWTTRTITTAADGAQGVVVADVDGDGDMDVVSASFLDDKLAWHENTAGNGSAWTTRTITTGANGAAGRVALDLDRDGDVDVVSGSVLDGTVAWYENTAGNGTAWTTRIVTTGAGDPGSVASADVDGDGDLDILSASGFAHAVAWYENTNGSGTAWTPHTISTSLYNARSVGAADVDGDGDMDVLAAAEIPGVLWYQNVAGNGTAWTPRTVDPTGNAADVLAADLDHDGDLDLVAASSEAASWHENSAGDGTTWTKRTLSGPAGIGSVFAADLDGDGDPDVASASSTNDTVAWHRNLTLHESACLVGPATVTTAIQQPYSVFAADMDGDGDADALSASRLDNKVAWYEKGSGASWTTHTITLQALGAQQVVAADVDGDGDVDALSAAYYSGIHWYENALGNGVNWINQVVFPGFGGDGGQLTVGVGDLDGDGSLDALSSTGFFDQFVKWHENANGDGSAWPLHLVAPTISGGSYGIQAADIDGDGDTDAVTIVGSIAFPGSGVVWFENTAGDGSAWTSRTVTTDAPFAVVVGDVDGDGDTDLATAGFNGLVWHENSAGNGTAWTPHTLDATLDRGVFPVDLDHDGDMDLLRAGSGSGGSVSWYENTAGNGAAWAPHTLPQAGASGTSVFAADLNEDGLPDILASTLTTPAVVWYANQGGQASLAASDIAPAGAVNSELVPMLRVDVTHLGRAGDGDLELASLGLLFEEAAGDPLSSAEANAVVENLHVYRDANGNGVFDPGTDVVVTTVPTLGLVNGVQTVPFSDGDAQVQVSLGTPRTYFVVAELTADASQQDPDQFRVTHLLTGAMASGAEDRTYDIPLRPACPADVPSSVLGPITPVELQGFSIE